MDGRTKSTTIGDGDGDGCATWPIWLTTLAWYVVSTQLLKARWYFGRYQKRIAVLICFFCNFINRSYSFSGTDLLYVCKQPCFTRLQQSSDKLESVISIISELKAKNGRIGDMAAMPASLGCCVQSVSTPTSSVPASMVPAKRAATGSVPIAKKLLRLEVNDISDNMP